MVGDTRATVKLYLVAQIRLPHNLEFPATPDSGPSGTSEREIAKEGRMTRGVTQSIKDHSLPRW